MVAPVQTSPSPLVKTGQERPVSNQYATINKIASYVCIVFIALAGMGTIMGLTMAFMTSSKTFLSIGIGSLLIGVTAYFLQDLFKQRFPKNR